MSTIPRIAQKKRGKGGGDETDRHGEKKAVKRMQK